MHTQKQYHLLNNSRFYIVVFSLLLSLTIFAWLRLVIDNDQTFLIRTQQCYGFVCLFFWYTALIIAPIGRIIGRRRVKHIEFARRAIGVSAFYFALLHALIALYGQLGGFESIQYLPSLFQWSLLAGAVSLLVLGLLSLTSFDRVIKVMTFRTWKWLHRFIYIASVLVIVHVWTIGTHLAYLEAQVAGYIALVLLIGLELFCTIKFLSDKYTTLKRTELYITVLTLWVVAAGTLFMMPYYIKNYHSRHSDHNTHSRRGVE